MKKRILSAVMAFVMLAGLLPQLTLPVMAADGIIYETQEFPTERIMNIKMTQTETWFNKYAKTAGGYNNSGYAGLDYNMSKRMVDNHNITTWTDDMNSSFRWLVENNQIYTRFGGTFLGDRHGSFTNHPFSNNNSHQYMELYGSYEIQGPGNDVERDIYTDEWLSAGNAGYISFYIGTGGCHYCGTPKFSKPVVAFADMKAPTITGWYMSSQDNSVSKDTYATDEMYITVEFSEPIRFADDNPASWSDVYLGLRLINKDTNAEYAVNGGHRAYLYALRDNKLIFKYDIPNSDENPSAMPNGQLPNHYIGGFTGIFDKDGNHCLNYTDDSGIGKYDLSLFAGSEELSGTALTDAGKYGFTSSKSFVTDLAGNEVAGNNTQSMGGLKGSEAYRPLMDLVQPYVEKIDLTVEDSAGNILNSSDSTGETINLFAKAGVKYRFTVQTSELLKTQDMEITLNLKDNQNDYIKLTPTGSGTLTIPNNPPEKQLLYYELALEDGMIPDNSESVQVIEVSTPSDPYENVLDNSKIPAIAQDSFPDLLAPGITTTKTQTNGVYEVDRTDDTIAFDFTLADDESHGKNNVSGIIPIGDMADLIGSLTVASANEDAPAGSVPFEYAVVTEGETPSYQSALLGNPIYFSQSPAGRRTLYIRVGETMPMDVLPLKVSISGSDIAGNTTTAEFTLDSGQIVDILDISGPEISFSGSSTGYDDATGSGSLSVNVSLSDINQISAQSVEYAWTEVGTQPTESDWVKAAFSDTDAQAMSGTIERTFAVTGDTEVLSYDLYVKASDLSTKKNQTVYGPKTFSYNRLYPKYSLSAPEADMPEEAVLNLEWAAYTPPEDGIYMDALVFLRPTNAGNFEVNYSGENNYALGYVSSLSESGGQIDLLDSSAVSAHGLVSLDPTTGEITYLSGDGGLFDKVASGEYYGTVDAIVYVGYGLNTSGEYSYPVSQSEFILRTAGAWTDEKFEVTAVWDNPEALLGGAEAWDPNETEAVGGLSTLAGQAITVTVEPIAAPEYGVSDVDFANSYVELEYSANVWEGGDGIAPGESEPVTVARFPLTGGTTRIILPDGLEYYTGDGYYKLRTYVQTVSGGGTDGIENTHFVNDKYIEFNPSPLLPFGLARIDEFVVTEEYPYNMQFSSLGKTTWYGYAANRDDGNTKKEYTQPGQLVLGTYADGETFTSHYHSLYFTAIGDMTLHQYIQVRNVTAGVNWKSKWHQMSNAAASANRFDTAVYDTAAEAAAASNEEMELPLVAGVENIIEYQARTKTGYSQTYSITILPDNTVDELVVEVSPTESDEPMTKATAAIKEIPNGATVYYARRADAASLFVWNEVSEMEYELGMDEIICFYATDMQGNVIKAEAAAPDFLWTTRPALTNLYDFPNLDYENTGGMQGNVKRMDMQAYQPGYNGRALLFEKGFKLHLTVNDEYGERIGVKSMTYDIPAESDWNGKGDFDGHRLELDGNNRKMGVFSFDVYREGDDAYITDLMFVHRYNNALEEGVTEKVTLTFTVEDSLGTLSEPLVYDFDMVNIEPKLLGVEMSEYMIFDNFTGNRTLWLPVVKATVPMAEVYPNSLRPEDNSDDIYRTRMGNQNIQNVWIKPFAAVYRDGVYDISFVDMFGDYYRQTFTQPIAYHTGSSGDEFDTGMDISFSDPDPETGKVTMHFKAMDKRMPVDIAQGTLPGSLWPGESSDTHTVLAEKTVEAEVELNPDEPVYILRYDPHELIYNNRNAYMSTFDGGPSVMVIPNFVNNPPVATVEWYFDEFGSNELPVDANGDVPSTTSENVTAYLVTDTLVNPINAKGNYHTFTYGEADSFTFEFEDYYGKQGSLTVSLSDIPIRLTEPVPDVLDTAKPDYTLEIYGMYNSMYEPRNAYSPNDGTAVTDVIYAINYVQGYLLSFQVADESPTKLVVKEAGTGNSVTSYKNAQSDTILGVSAAGTQVAISKAVAFDVVIIDASDNATVVTVEDSAFMFDTEAPEVEAVDKQQTNFYEVTAYIKLKDNVSSEDEIRWIYPAEARKVTSGEYAGRYALIFDGNGSINIRYADALGNQGTYDILVEELDESAPAVKKVTWSPGNISADGTMDDSTAPQQMTNTSVVAVVEFSTQIQELSISRKDGEALDSYYVSALLQEDQAIITFNDSLLVWNDETSRDDALPWDLDLAFTGVNGITGNYNLKLGAVIDKQAPYVDIEVKDEPNSPYAEVTFTGTNEAFYMVDTGSKLYKAGEPVTRQITENGKHTFKFVDAAGNMYVEIVEIKNIDNDAPVLLLGDLPELDYSTNGTVTFKATLNEGGTITVNGNTQTVAAPNDANGNGKFDENECNWVTFSVSENGGYKITATDKAGLTTEQYLTVNCIDRMAPKIEFAPSTFNVIAGTGAEYAKELLMSGITTWDTVSKAEEIEVKMDDFDETILSTAGVHTITYSVTDKAGNQTTGKRYLRVYSAREPQILLNGTKTFSKEVTLLNDTNITLSVSNLPGGDGEPYTVYLRQGRWSEGQMKRNYDVIDTAEFTVDKNKYYTLYIVTQSRGTYLTNFYVQ